MKKAMWDKGFNNDHNTGLWESVMMSKLLQWRTTAHYINVFPYAYSTMVYSHTTVSRHLNICPIANNTTNLLTNTSTLYLNEITTKMLVASGQQINADTFKCSVNTGLCVTGSDSKQHGIIDHSLNYVVQISEYEM